MPYTFNGRFLTQRITGIQRYATELVSELDKLAAGQDWEIAVPGNLKTFPLLRNIRVVKVGRWGGFIWEQATLPRHLRKTCRTGVYLCNVMPLSAKGGVAVIHDISYRVNPSFFVTVRDRLSALWHRLQYRVIVHKCSKLVTVSTFSADELARIYDARPERIHVIPNAWQHMERVRESADFFERHPGLTHGGYYASLSTLAKNKNLPWLLRAAARNPEVVFVIAGGGDLTSFARFSGSDVPSNVLFIGYVDDGDVRALLTHCKAFIFPTFYEGFGLPPLEAAACGARRLILSDIPSLREVFGDAAEYVDPNDSAPALNGDHSPLTEAQARALLARYSWAQSAHAFKDLLV